MCSAEPLSKPNFRDARYKRGPQITDPDGFKSVVNGSRARVSFGDLPIYGPKTSQRAQREFRFSNYAHDQAIHMMAADVSSALLASPWAVLSLRG